MNDVVHAELIKLRTSRATVGLLTAGLAYAALNGAVTAAFAGRDQNAELGTAANLGSILRGGNVATWVILLAAIISVTGEYRHRTITATYLATPRRGTVVAAKLTVYGALGVAYAVVSMLLGLAAASPQLLSSSADLQLGDPHVARVAIGLVVATGLFGLAGVGIGSVVRNQTLATVGAIVWLVAAENIVGSVVGWPTARWLPGQAAAAAAGSGGDTLLPMAAGAALFTAYALAAGMIGSRLSMSRDIA